MKQVVINEKNLTENDLDFSVIRVKALIVNSNNEVLIAHNNGTYQFPGGHKEDDEFMDDCLYREVKEETGIDEEVKTGPFMQITTFDDNYFDTGKKVSNRIYYFIVRTDQEPDFEKTHYDELECQTDFNLFYVKLGFLKQFLEDAVNEGTLDYKIGKEMLLVAEEYNNVYGVEE